MSDPATTASNSTFGSHVHRGRGHSKSRGGLGKYLRARGRRGSGRPAEFGNRLLLEGEELQQDGEEDEEERREEARKYSKRQLGSNADRYVEPAPDLNSDGEIELEPEVNLSNFLDRQRISDLPARSTPLAETDDAEDVDPTLAHISSRPQAVSNSKKGQVKQINWDEQLDDLSREKAAAEAARELKARFRAKTQRMRGRPQSTGVATGREQKQEKVHVEAPPLPIDSVPPLRDAKEEMQDFLDELLS